MKKIKVLHLTSTRYGIGGVERLLLDMSDKYDPERFEVSYCNLFCDADGAGAFPTDLRNRGLKVFAIRGKRWKDLPGILKDLVDLMRSERFDIVHLHMLQATIIGAIAAKLTRRRTVVTKHYTPGPSHTGGTKSRHLLQGLDLYFTRSADHVVAVSEYVMNFLFQAGIPASRASVIYNGIDLSAFDRASQGGSPEIFPEGSFVIGTVGSLTQLKSHVTLVDAFSQVAADHSHVRLLIVGEGPELGNLQAQCERLGIVDKVHFMGFSKDVPSLLKMLDVYVQPSTFESFGIVLLEAAAARKPVIATAVGGMPEIVVLGETGFLVPVGDASELADAIRKLIDNCDQRLLMGEKGRSIVSERFLIEHTVDKYQKLYLQLSANRPLGEPALEVLS